MTPELANAIEKARDHEMSASEKFEQRVSFVYGQQDHDKTGKSKDQIRQMLAKSGGWPLAEMDELAAIRKVLADPNAVHVNMLRGIIARPSLAQIIHLYGRDALVEALAIEAEV